MNKYQAYPEYKDSGVEWLGEIPSSWKLCRLKFMAKIKNGQDYKSVQVDEGYPVMGSGGQFTYASKFMYDKESVLLGRKGTIDKPLYIDEPFWSVDTMYYTEVNEEVHTKYLYYLALTIQFDRYSTNTALPSMTQEHLGNYTFSIPNGEDDKKKIANFLDHETAKIDTLIEKQQQLIALLKEKRQAVISHAVTKGLNPDAPMSDSGVEWLGEVPEHWVVSALKYHVDTVNGFGFSSSDVCEEGVPFIRAGNIKKKSITPTDLYLPQRVVDRYKRVILSENDIVISMVGSDPKILESAVGQVGMVPKSMAGSVPNQNVVILREKSNSILKLFLFYTLCSEAYRNHLNVFSHKLANQSIISSSLIVNAKFMLPRVGEQSEIISFLADRLAKFDEVMDRNYRSLELLKERRTALISAAVTGKIDVRNWNLADA